ncbi:MAG: hypothetical protein ACFFCD_06930 [Promethearchaeota archaeon]
MADRPIGVTIICILQWIGAIVLIALGALAAIAGLAGGYGWAFIAGAIMLILGIIMFFITFGLWQLKKWAWWITIILNVISIIFSAAGGAFFGVIIPLIVLIYLIIVREHFR